MTEAIINVEMKRQHLEDPYVVRSSACRRERESVSEHGDEEAVPGGSACSDGQCLQEVGSRKFS